MTFHPTQNPHFWRQTADSCLADERYEKAAEAYLRVVELSPNDADAWKGRGEALYRLGRNADAADCLERALLISPDNEELISLLSDVLGALGEIDKKTACIIRLGELSEKTD